MPEDRIRNLCERDFSVTDWSGGTTTELAIEPEETSYQERTFLWRVSSATVDLEVSVFTSLPDYDRIIMTLDGTMELSHNGGKWIRLSEFRPHSFDGADRTISRGKVRDFNLMLRKGRCSGFLEPISAETGDTGDRVFSEGVIYCFKGSLMIRAGQEEGRLLEAGNALRISDIPPGTKLSWKTGPGTQAVIAGILRSDRINL